MNVFRLISAQVVMTALLWNPAPARAQGQRLYERVLIERSGSRRTVKPIVMGTHYAITSMMPQATLAAQRILESGGNAFDAVVGGQAVLGLVAPASNGVGSDAMLLVYVAKQKKVWSINATLVTGKSIFCAGCHVIPCKPISAWMRLLVGVSAVMPAKPMTRKREMMFMTSTRPTASRA